MLGKKLLGLISLPIILGIFTPGYGQPMIESSEDDVIGQILEEYEVFYRNIAKNSKRIPKTISGVAADGSQFIYDMSGLQLGRIQKDEYIKVILSVETAVYYAHGALYLTEHSKEEVIIVSVASGRYVQANYSLNRLNDGEIELIRTKVYEGDNPEDYPPSWQLSADDLPVDATKQYIDLWKTSQDNVIRRKR
jgi:hypothetical protein